MKAPRRKRRTSEKTPCARRETYESMGVVELQRTHQVEEDNRPLKELAADPSLHKPIPQEVLSEKV